VHYNFVVGILIGTLTMELGGVVTIKCEKTGYWAEMEFKLKVKVQLLKQQCLQATFTVEQ